VNQTNKQQQKKPKRRKSTFGKAIEDVLLQHKLRKVGKPDFGVIITIKNASILANVVCSGRNRRETEIRRESHCHARCIVGKLNCIAERIAEN
jgi:hypothetical protein